MESRIPIALSIAGSDSGAGAGIQAELKTYGSLGVYGASVLTVLTAQNTQGVQAVFPVPTAFIEAQLNSVFSDFNVAAIKTGALGNAEIVECVASFLAGKADIPLVLDPVMISKHGHALLEQPAIAVLREKLLPLAFVVTPNLAEAAELAGMPPISRRSEMQAAAERIAESGCRAVLVKGGHSTGSPDDLLWSAGSAQWFSGERVDTPHSHGTGCTFGAAITAMLVQGFGLAEAVAAAKDYIQGALRHGQIYGKGINPVNHFWQQQHSSSD